MDCKHTPEIDGGGWPRRGSWGIVVCAALLWPGLQCLAGAAQEAADRDAQTAEVQRLPAPTDRVPTSIDRVPTSTAEVLQSMAGRAGVVFAGEVAEIRLAGDDSQPGGGSGRIDAQSASGEGGVVEVVFHVEDAMLGCAAGGDYILRESAALWRNSPGRYRVGQRAVWMLYRPNAGGLSSPVDGMMGVLPLTGRGDAMQVDLRWARTSVGRVQPRLQGRGPMAGLPTAAPSTAAAASLAAVPGFGESSHSALAVESPAAPYDAVLHILQPALRGALAGREEGARAAN